jgi:acetylornithine deacetylase
MNVFELTRRLIDIESITPNEREVGNFLFEYLGALAREHAGTVERMPVEAGRDNILACFGDPIVTLSTHIDTVPPFISSGEDESRITGRGACDTKGIISAMIESARRLLAQGVRNFGLLFVVGEERNSAGALVAAEQPRGSRFLINGEPTEIIAKGKMAHSAYPELGESAILKLLDALARLRSVAMPVDEVLGPGTLNIGTIAGGRAPNVIPDEAKAEMFIRVVGDVTELRKQVEAAVQPDAEASEVLFIPAVRLGSLDGFKTTVVAFTTDIPAFNGRWGKPYLIGPGSIHVAHTSGEYIPKNQLLEAVTLYEQMVRRLLEGQQ